MDEITKPEKGHAIQFDSGQQQEVIECTKCSHLMINIDADELKQGDLKQLKKLGVRVSNPDTEEPICVSCEYKTIGRKLADWFEDDDDDDSGFFSSSTGGFLGGSTSIGGFGGFGGFGGGSFGGGGASRSF